MEFTKKHNLRVLTNKQSKAFIYDAPQCNKLRKKEY